MPHGAADVSLHLPEDLRTTYLVAQRARGAAQPRSTRVSIKPHAESALWRMVHDNGTKTHLPGCGCVLI